MYSDEGMWVNADKQIESESECDNKLITDILKSLFGEIKSIFM